MANKLRLIGVGPTRVTAEGTLSLPANFFDLGEIDDTDGATVTTEALAGRTLRAFRADIQLSPPMSAIIAPSIVGSIADKGYVEGNDPQAFDLAPYFANTTGGSWSATGPGLSVSQAGVATFTVGAAQEPTDYSVSYTRPGYPPATQTFNIEVLVAGSDQPPETYAIDYEPDAVVVAEPIPADLVTEEGFLVL